MAVEEMINLTRLGDFHADITVDAHILKRSTVYAVDDKVNKGLIYLKCTQAGTTASTALSLSGVSVGDELTDGTAKWKVLSIKGVPEGGGGTGAGLEDWESNHDYAVDDIYVYEGEIYKTLIAFTSGSTEDSRTKVNNIVPSVWTANTAYTAGDIIEHTDVTTLKKVYYNVTANFTSGATFEVTAEMQELQIVEEYVPHPLTNAQVQNLINGFNPSGMGTYVQAVRQTLFEGNYSTSNDGTSFTHTQVLSYPITSYDQLEVTITGNIDGDNREYSIGIINVEDIVYSTFNTRIVSFASGSAYGCINIGFSDSTHFGICFSAHSGWTMDTAITKIVGIKYVQPENNYSTEEQRIGTWIDGKPLYQRTYTGTMPSIANTSADLQDCSSFMDKCIEISGFITTDGINSFPINLYDNAQIVDGFNRSCTVYLRGGKKLSASVTADTVNTTYYITIKYTKITD